MYICLFRSAPQPSGEDKVEDRGVERGVVEDPKTKEIKRRVESWLKESEEDANMVNLHKGPIHRSIKTQMQDYRSMINLEKIYTQ